MFLTGLWLQNRKVCWRMEEKDSSREGEGMENKVMKFYSKAGNNIILRAIPGHFATSHSHINYYVDMTGLKTRRSEAAAVGKAFVPVSYTHLEKRTPFILRTAADCTGM